MKFSRRWHPFHSDDATSVGLLFKINEDNVLHKLDDELLRKDDFVLTASIPMLINIMIKLQCNCMVYGT